MAEQRIRYSLTHIRSSTFNFYHHTLNWVTLGGLPLFGAADGHCCIQGGAEYGKQAVHSLDNPLTMAVMLSIDRSYYLFLVNMVSLLCVTL